MSTLSYIVNVTDMADNEADTTVDEIDQLREQYLRETYKIIEECDNLLKQLHYTLEMDEMEIVHCGMGINLYGAFRVIDERTHHIRIRSEGPMIVLGKEEPFRTEDYPAYYRGGIARLIIRHLTSVSV